jgi:hypothetical protein
VQDGYCRRPNGSTGYRWKFNRHKLRLTEGKRGCGIFYFCCPEGIGMIEVVISNESILAGRLILSLLAGVGLGLPFIRRFLASREAEPRTITTALSTTPYGDQ